MLVQQKHMKLQQLKEDNKGQALLIAVIVVTAILLTVVTTILSIATSEYSLSQNDILESQIKALSESGLENALLQIGEQGQSYTGGTFSSPINTTINGTDTVTVTYNTSTNPVQATIVSTAEGLSPQNSQILVKRTIQVVAQLGQNPPILNYSLFANDTIMGGFFQVNGDIQSNNELQFYDANFNSNNINSVGIGGGFGDYFYQVNNTPTSSIINLQSNFITGIIVNSDLPGELSCQNSFWGFNSCIITNSTIGSQVNLSPPAQINLPVFNMSSWENTAQTNNTYYTSSPSFVSFLFNHESINTTTQTDTISPPAGVYYIDSNLNLPTTDSAGNTITYNFTNSSIIVKNKFQTNASFIDTSPYSPSANEYLPPLIAGNQGIYIGSGGNLNLNVTGIIYSPGNIYINNDTDDSGDGTTNVSGALWAGGNIFINNSVYDSNSPSSTQITLNSNIINETTGFNFVLGTTTVISWNEIN